MTASPFDAHYRSRSLWLDGLKEPLEPRPALPGDVDVDVAIVGAGFTGLWAAHELALRHPELRVAVLEREIAGFGASGRNGGWASAGIAGSARAYGERTGSDRIRRAVRATHDAVDEIGRVAAAEGIDCAFKKAGTLTIATSEPQRTRLRALLEATALNGDQHERVEPGEFVRAADTLEAVHTPHAARLDPARLARGLARAAERRGVVIYERTSAREIVSGAVRCASGTVRADTILRATESYTTQLPGRRLRYLPLYSLMIATEPLTPEVWEQIGWRDGLLIADAHHLFFYAQRTPDGRIAIGGRGAPYRLPRPMDPRHERAPAVAERLAAAIRRHFPAAADARITHHWGGPLAVPRDWAMSVDFNRRTRIGAAGGYSGHGVVAAHLAGRTLADLALGERTDRTALPWVGHRSRGWEPEPLRFLASRAIVRTLERADRIEDVSGRPARRVSALRPFLPPR